MLALYHTLTVTEKGEVEQKLPANIKMADMEAFVRNYDTFGGVPVSYTHLDVYKRQFMVCPAAG